MLEERIWDLVPNSPVGVYSVGLPMLEARIRDLVPYSLVGVYNVGDLQCGGTTLSGSTMLAPTNARGTDLGSGASPNCGGLQCGGLQRGGLQMLEERVWDLVHNSAVGVYRVGGLQCGGSTMWGSTMWVFERSRCA